MYKEEEAEVSETEEEKEQRLHEETLDTPKMVLMTKMNIFQFKLQVGREARQNRHFGIRVLRISHCEAYK